MANRYYQIQDESIPRKIMIFLESVWPSVYKAFNGFLFALWDFVKGIFSGLWHWS